MHRRLPLLPAWIAALLLCILWNPAPSLALMALPDVGIDYQTMKVVQAGKLSELGMTKVQEGDTISMRLSPEEKKIFFKNLRTGQEIPYPPLRPKEKGR